MAPGARTTLGAATGATALAVVGGANSVDFVVGLQVALLGAGCDDDDISSDTAPLGLPPVAVIDGPWGWPLGVLLILAGVTAAGLITAAPLRTTMYIRQKAMAVEASGTMQMNTCGAA
jgi:hypothetical protein